MKLEEIEKFLGTHSACNHTCDPYAEKLIDDLIGIGLELLAVAKAAKQVYGHGDICADSKICLKQSLEELERD